MSQQQPTLHPLQADKMKVTPMGAAWMVAITAVLAGVMIALPWEKEVIFGMDRVTMYDNDPYQNNNDTSVLHTRDTLYFPCSGVRCHAWLYLPRYGLSMPCKV